LLWAISMAFDGEEFGGACPRAACAAIAVTLKASPTIEAQTMPRVMERIVEPPGIHRILTSCQSCATLPPLQGHEHHLRGDLRADAGRELPGRTWSLRGAVFEQRFRGAHVLQRDEKFGEVRGLFLCAARAFELHLH